MWKSEKRPRQEDCRHKTRVSTTFAGLERSSCADCGHVTIGRAGENFLGLELELKETVNVS